MRQDRLQQLINVLERADSFDINTWQNNKAPFGFIVCQNEDLLHACGNTACVAGWLAISPEFQSAGGSVDAHSGAPLFHRYTGVHAVAEWLECDPTQYFILYQLITGDEEEELSNFRQLHNLDWSDFTAKDAINFIKEYLVED